MTQYKIYNLPIFLHEISISLIYNIEGNNLAVTKDNKYVIILADTEFIKCTLAQGHFCNLNTALNHTHSNPCVWQPYSWKIMTKFKTKVINITGPQVHYLDQGNWAISVTVPIQMEIKCSDHTHIKTLQPPITLINLQPACSAFSPVIKLPHYFKQYSKGFHVALRAANLHLPKFCPTDFRIWKTFNLLKIEPNNIENLKKLTPAPAIPTDKLRTQLASFRQIETNKSTSWIYYVGGGSGSGSIFLIVICCLACWRCKHHQVKKPDHLLILPILFQGIQTWYMQSGCHTNWTMFSSWSRDCWNPGCSGW